MRIVVAAFNTLLVVLVLSFVTFGEAHAVEKQKIRRAARSAIRSQGFHDFIGVGLVVEAGTPLVIENDSFNSYGADELWIAIETTGQVGSPILDVEVEGTTLQPGGFSLAVCDLPDIIDLGVFAYVYGSDEDPKRDEVHGD